MWTIVYRVTWPMTSSKYWTTYREGCLRYLASRVIKPGAVSWVLKPDEGDKQPDGEPGPAGVVITSSIWFRLETDVAASNRQRPNRSWASWLEAKICGIEDKYHCCFDRTVNRKQ
jgi:hypothetical protein